MGCPTRCVLNENLTFTVQAADNTGAPATPTGNVNYAVYEDSTTAEILTSTMTKDFDAKTGFCLATIACTTANGFERHKTYTIRITAVIGGINVAKTYNFICLGIEDEPTATTGALTSTANFKSYAKITGTGDDTLIGYLISRATAAIENYCDRVLRSASYRELYDGDGTDELYLKQYPVTVISSLATSQASPLRITSDGTAGYKASVSCSSTTLTCSLDGTGSDLTLADYTLTTLAAAINAFGSGWSAEIMLSVYAGWTATELLPCFGLDCYKKYVYVKTPGTIESDFDVDDEIGYIELPTGFPKGTRNIVISYTAGYSTIPADLEQICIDLVNIYYRGRSENASVRAESLGDHSITFSDESLDIPKAIKKRLATYRNWIIR